MLNVHPSLLPRWRGAAPIERAMMAGDAETGVTIMRVTAGWDSGPIYLAGAEPIHPDDDYGTLAPRLEELGARLLVQALDEHLTPVEQDESLVTYAHKIGPRERALDPTQPPEQVERTIRALRPHIGSRLPLPDGSFLGVIGAQVDGPTRAPAGGLVRAEGDRLLLDCNGGALELTEIRPPGGRPMAASDWLRGRPDQRADELPLRPDAAGPRPDRGAGRRPRRVGGRQRRVAAARLRARRPRQSRGARRDGGARHERRARDARARRVRARPARPGARRRCPTSEEAALRAMAAPRGGPERAGRDRLRVRPPRRAARPRLAARAALASRRRRARGGRLRARRPPGRGHARGADRAVGRRRARRPRLGDVRARHARRAGQPGVARRARRPARRRRRGHAARGDPRARAARRHARRGAGARRDRQRQRRHERVAPPPHRGDGEHIDA